MPWNDIKQTIALVFDNGVQSSCKVSSSKWRRRFAKCISVISDKIFQWWHSTKFNISSFKSLVWSFSKRSCVAACLGSCRFRVRSNCLDLAVGLGVSDLVEAMQWPVDPKLRSYKRWDGSFFGRCFFASWNMYQSYSIISLSHLSPSLSTAAGSWSFRQLLEAELPRHWRRSDSSMASSLPSDSLDFSFYRKSVWYVCLQIHYPAVFFTRFPLSNFVVLVLRDVWLGALQAYQLLYGGVCQGALNSLICEIFVSHNSDPP